MSAKDIKSATLMLNGVFARLQSGVYSTEKAVKDALSITEEIDKVAETMDSAAIKLRKQNAAFAMETYNLTAELKKQKEKNHKLQTELDASQMDLSQYSDDLFEERSLSSLSQEKKSDETEPKSVLMSGADLQKQDSSDQQDNQKDKV